MPWLKGTNKGALGAQEKRTIQINTWQDIHPLDRINKIENCGYRDGNYTPPCVSSLLEKKKAFDSKGFKFC